MAISTSLHRPGKHLQPIATDGVSLWVTVIHCQLLTTQKKMEDHRAHRHQRRDSAILARPLRSQQYIFILLSVLVCSNKLFRKITKHFWNFTISGRMAVLFHSKYFSKNQAHQMFESRGSKTIFWGSRQKLIATANHANFRAVVLNRGGFKKFLGRREPLHALQLRKFWTGMCPFETLRQC